MGARDAIYQMESRGIKVKVSGYGRVKEQSLMAGTRIKPGMVCELRLTPLSDHSRKTKQIAKR